MLKRQPRSVLELGAGRSSLVIARCLSLNGGGRLTSIDQSPHHSAEIWTEVEAIPNVDARLLTADLRSKINAEGLMYRFENLSPDFIDRGPFDFVFIDGPPFFFGRDGVLHLIVSELSPGAIIVMDDTRRGSEQRALARWLRSYPGLHPEIVEPEFGGEEGHGIAILRYEGGKSNRRSVRNFVGATLEWLLTWRHVRWKFRVLRGTN